MKTRLILLILILTGLLIAQTERGLSIKSRPGNEGKRYAICVGINEYEYTGISKLKKARNDAEALGKAFGELGQFDHVFVMTCGEDPRTASYPTVSKLRNQLNFIENFIEPNDFVVFSFSGHGVSDDKGDGYLLAADTDPRNVFNTSIKLKEVTEMFQRKGVKKSLLLVDACREEIQDSRSISGTGLKAERFEKSEVAAVLYATRAGGFSYEDDKSGYGAFTNYILKGLSGEADRPEHHGNGDGIVTFTELKNYVEDKVRTWALNNQRVQIPYTKLLNETYGDLALAAYKGVTFRHQTANKQVDQNLSNFTYDEKYYFSKDGKRMVFVPGQRFRMGSNFGSSLEQPEHMVNVVDFYIDETEVTNLQFKRFLEDTGYIPRGSLSHFRDRKFNKDDQPVVNVDYEDALEYAKWAGKRLPSEAEWEAAARGGQDFEYPTGEDMTENQARFGMNITIGSTVSVKSYKPNEYGIYDLAGNASEWVQGVLYQYPGNETRSRYYGSARVPRGGSWLSPKDDCKSYRRAILDTSYDLNNIGFRCAISISEINGSKK